MMRNQVETAGTSIMLAQPEHKLTAWPQAPGGAPQSNRRYYRRGVLWLCLVSLCLGLGACATKKFFCINAGPNCVATAFAVTQSVDVRFAEVSPFPTPIPSPGAPTPIFQMQTQEFWLKAGEHLNVSWSQFNFLANAPGAICDSGPAPPDCQKIWVCDTAKTATDCSDCVGVTLAFDPTGWPILFERDGFMPASEHREILRADLEAQVGCRFNPLTFDPTEHTASRHITYQLKDLRPGAPVTDPIPFTSYQTLAEAKVFVLGTGESEAVMYPLQPFTPPNPIPSPAPAATPVYYKGTVPGDTIFSNRFSPSLRIRLVQVWKGKPDTDPVTGKFALKDSSFIQLSRVVFIPNYQSGPTVGGGVDNNSCYAHYNSTVPLSSQAGDIDLAQCRLSTTSTGGPSLDATPTYLTADSRHDLLTWVVEFNPADFPAIGGGVVPSLDEGEVLAIKFLIEAN